MNRIANIMAMGTTAATSSPLLTNLISYWKLDEASGTRVDSHGSNDLTDNNTVGAATGIINDGANFVAANTEYLSHASNASLQTGDIDFTISAWVKLAAKGAYRMIVAKDLYNTSREYWVNYIPTFDRFAFQVTSDGTDATQIAVYADALGSPSTGTWYFIVVCHDSVNNAIKIQVNNGTINSAGTAAGVYSGAAQFMLGANSDFGTPSNFMDGMIDEVGFWKRVLTAGEITQLYNGGAGISYEEIAYGFSPRSIAGLELWLKADSLRLNDADPVATWTDYSANGYSFVEATNRPTYRATGGPNSHPCVEFDGTNDALSTVVTSVSQPYTIIVVFDVGRPIEGNEPRPVMGDSFIYAGTVLGCTGGSANTFRVLVGTFNGGSSTVHINGSLDASGAAGSGSIGTVVALNCFNNATFFAGKICEIIVYDSALSSTDRGNVEDYLQAKYGI